MDPARGRFGGGTSGKADPVNTDPGESGLNSHSHPQTHHSALVCVAVPPTGEVVRVRPSWLHPKAGFGFGPPGSEEFERLLIPHGAALG